MIQRAVRRNPRAPDYEGLGAYGEHIVDGSTGAPTADFDRHVTEQQRTEALVLKQMRLVQEEAEAGSKRKKDGGDGGKKGQKGNAQDAAVDDG